MAKHGHRGHRVGRRHDCAQRHCCTPRHLRDQPPRDDSHAGGGQTDGDQRERSDGNPVSSQVPQRCIIGGVQENGSHEQDQQDVRWHWQSRRSRQPDQAGATEGKESWIGNAQAAGEQLKDNRKCKKYENRLED